MLGVPKLKLNSVLKIWREYDCLTGDWEFRLLTFCAASLYRVTRQVFAFLRG